MSSPLPMFPLGAVLVPHAWLPLHVFEPRYRVLAFDCTRGPGEFGVVLIERGSEVGGDDERFSVGTVARLVEAAELPDGRWMLNVVGTRRIRVAEWLAADPYPRATVRDLAEPPWSEAAESARRPAERAVRRSLALAAEAGEAVPPATIELAGEPLTAAWQLVALAPLGSFDKQRLLEMDDHRTRLEELAALARDQAEMFAYRLSGE